MKVFISYSHRDANALDRLHTHLSVLRREGQVTEWFDRDILAGSPVDSAIEAELMSSELVLFLVSPDFLASDYCYEREMTAAISLHESGAVRLIPIIAEPCDWMATPLGRFKALPRDGKPISEWSNANVAYLDVVGELRRIVSGQATIVAGSNSEMPTRSTDHRISPPRYRVKREFDQIDRTDFARSVYENIRDYFRQSVTELDGVAELRGRLTEMSTTSFTCTVVNRAVQRGTSHITVHMRSGRTGLSDIYYSFEENASPNTANGGFNVVSDDYELYLASMFSYASDEKRLTSDGAAKELWSLVLEHAGVSYD